MDFFRVELFRNGGIIGNIGKENRDPFALAFDGATGGENLIGQVFGCVGLGLVIGDGRGFFQLFQVTAAFITKNAVRLKRVTAGRADQFKLIPAFLTIFGPQYP